MLRARWEVERAAAEKGPVSGLEASLRIILFVFNKGLDFDRIVRLRKRVWNE